MDTRLQADIQGAESCKLTAYRDTRGFWTIGWGHLLDQSIDWTGHTITQAVADALLAGDIAEAQAHAEKLPEYADQTDCRENAITELVFNMGLQHWLGFKKCRAAIQSKNWQEAVHELLSSAWSGQVGTKRSGRLAGYLLTGSY